MVEKPAKTYLKMLTRVTNEDFVFGPTVWARAEINPVKIYSRQIVRTFKFHMRLAEYLGYGSIAASGPIIRIKDRSEHYHPLIQFDAQGITKPRFIPARIFRWEIYDDVSAAITGILAFKIARTDSLIGKGPLWMMA